MKYFKQIIYCFLILELIHLLFGLFRFGKSVFLPFTNYNSPALFYDTDSLYGITKLKNTEQLISYPWGNIMFQTNSLGFRDDEFHDKGVLVVGNSFTEGYGISKKHRFTEFLEEKTNIPFHNAGNSGVWTPIQSLVLIKDLAIIKKIDFDRILLILTPAEIANIGKRNPKNDSFRNYPYKDGTSIKFHTSKNNSFKKELSKTQKTKRLSKNFLVFKLYRFFKYYGAAKFTKKEISFHSENLKWFLSKVIEANFKVKIDVIVVNNLNRSSLINIKDFEKNYNNERLNLNVIEFPNNLYYYFTSNGHLNKKGNEKLASLIEEIL